MIKQIYTTGDIAKLCGVNFRTVIRWIEKGYLKAHKLPGRGDNRVNHPDLESFMQANSLPMPQEWQVRRQALVVDDDLPMARAIARVLKKAGFEVDMAQDGFEAGLALASGRYQIMTLDLRMPSLDGFGVLERLAQDDRFGALKILVISAENQSQLNRAIEMGADDVLSKPFDNPTLTAKVESLLTQ